MFSKFKRFDGGTPDDSQRHLRDAILLSEEIVKPRIVKLSELPEKDRGEEIVKLTMALGYALAIMGTAFYKCTPEEMAEKVRKQVFSSMEIIEEGLENLGVKRNAEEQTESDSIWGIGDPEKGDSK